MSITTIAPAVIETEPGKVMPEALIELDFKTNGPLIATPATMDSTTLCCTCSWKPPAKP